MGELEDLIKEQQHDMRYGSKAWPEFPSTVSLDKLRSNFLEVDDRGTIHYSSKRMKYPSTLTGKHRNRPHGTRCTRHPGQERRAPKGKLRADGRRDALGQVYCAGCRREYRLRMKGESNG